MGIYLEGVRGDAPYCEEAARQDAVDRARPFRHRDDGRLQSIVQRAAAAYGTAAAAISIVDREEQVFLARRGFDGWSTPRSVSFCAITIQQPGEVLIVSDAGIDPRFRDNPAVTSEPHVRFYAGVSIVDGSGYLLGALCVFDPSPRPQRMRIEKLVALTREVEQIISR